jgi:hypothetical protein
MWRHEVSLINLPKRIRGSGIQGPRTAAAAACVPAAKATELVKLRTGARPQSATTGGASTQTQHNPSEGEFS